MHLVNGEGEYAVNPIHAIEIEYQKEQFDEFIEPIVMVNSDNQPIAKIEKKMMQ